jgi:uncharacterized protein YqhQ
MPTPASGGSARTAVAQGAEAGVSVPVGASPSPVAADAAAAGEPAPAGVAREDGLLRARRDAPVGGQAVLEGVMMRGVGHWALAVRKPSAGQLEAEQFAPAHPPAGEIQVTTHPLRSALRRHRWLRLPVLRGVVALGGSLAIGFRALEASANAQFSDLSQGREPTPDARAPQGPSDGSPAQEGSDGLPAGVWAGTLVVAIVLAIGLFFLVPVALTSVIKQQLGSSLLFWVVEGVLRTAIFLGYLFAISRLASMRRVLEYHGAEHKTISCFEAGLALTPANAGRFSRLHPRCGTSFLLVVMIVAIFVFAPIGLPAWYWLLATRVLGVPVIAGISFELIKFAGRNRNRPWVRALMWPGLKLQLLTTAEPDHAELAVAIAALEAVLALEEPGVLSAADMVGVELVA